MSVFKSIPDSTVRIVPFNAYKTWTLTGLNIQQTTNGLFSSSANTVSASFYDGTFYADKLSNTSSEATTSYGQYKRLIWNSIYNSHYHYYNTNTGFHNIQSFSERRNIHSNVRILSIPNIFLGKGIKRNSVTLSVTSGSMFTISASNLSFIDDGNGNLVNSIPGNLFTGSNSNIIEFDFNDTYQYSNTLSTISTVDKSQYKLVATTNNVLFNNTNSPMLGMKGNFNTGNSGSIRITNPKQIQFNNYSDYTVIVNVDLPISQSDFNSTVNTIITKNGLTNQEILVNGISGSSFVDNRTIGAYPFSIELLNSTSPTTPGAIKASLYDGNTTVFVTSSIYVTGSNCTVSLIKSGSTLSLYVNSGSYSSITIPSPIGPYGNQSDILLGMRGDYMNTLSGSINYCLIYPNAVTTASINNIIDSYKKNYYQIGNVLYKEGLIVLSSPTNHSGSTNFGITYNLSYKSTLPITEYEVVCTAPASTFNVSQNPTIVDLSDNGRIVAKNFTTSSNFMPYVSCIGLYNSMGDLLVVGKLSKPYRLSNVIDSTFITRFDS